MQRMVDFLEGEAEQGNLPENLNVLDVGEYVERGLQKRRLTFAPYIKAPAMAICFSLCSSLTARPQNRRTCWESTTRRLRWSFANGSPRQKEKPQRDYGSKRWTSWRRRAS